MLRFKLFRRVSFFITLLLIIISSGTIGFMLIEDWNFNDSFFMTIITISTVGFGAVHPLSPNGMIFTSILIISSFGTFAFAINSITSFLAGGEYKRFLIERKEMKELEKLKNHVIICGFGRVGMQVAMDLKAHETPFVIIENDREFLSTFENEHDFKILVGDASQDENLIKAGIHSAKALISCLPKDADNLYVVLSAKEIKKDLLVISRASNQSTVNKLRIAGAQNVIMPNAIGGSHMASLISTPDVVEFIDIIRLQGSQGANIESISFNDLPDQFRNKTIGELEAKKITGVTIIGFRAPNGEYFINPDNEIEVVPQSKLFVLGNQEQIKKFNKLFGISNG